MFSIIFNGITGYKTVIKIEIGPEKLCTLTLEKTPRILTEQPCPIVTNLFIDLSSLFRLNLVNTRKVLEELILSDLGNSNTEIGDQVNTVPKPGD